MKKILVLIISLVMTAVAVPSAYAAGGSAVKVYSLKLNKTYKTYDVTGDKKADTVLIKASRDSAGSLKAIKIMVNGKVCLSSNKNVWKTNASYSYTIVKLIRLANGKPLLYIDFTTPNGYYAGGWTYQYKSGKMKLLLKSDNLILKRYAKIYPDRWRSYARLKSVKGNTLVYNVGSFTTPSKNYKYGYKGGKLVAVN